MRIPGTEDKSRRRADSMSGLTGRLRRVEPGCYIAIRRRDGAGAGIIGHGRRVGISETALKKIILTLGLNIAIGERGEGLVAGSLRRLSFSVR